MDDRQQPEGGGPEAAHQDQDRPGVGMTKAEYQEAMAKIQAKEEQIDAEQKKLAKEWKRRMSEETDPEMKKLLDTLDSVYRDINPMYRP